MNAPIERPFWERAIRITDPIVRYGGMFAGLVYLVQTWKIVVDPKAAAGVSLIMLLFFNVMQISSFLNCIAKGNKPMAFGMLGAFFGGLTATGATIWCRLFVL